MTKKPETFGPRAIGAWFLALLVTLTLAACGGSGAGAGGGDLGGVNEPETLTLIASPTALESREAATVELTAIVKDGANRSLANQNVSFLVDDPADPASTLQIVNARTDAAGQASARLSSQSREAREIEVTARVDGYPNAVDVERIEVVGTVVAISGATSIPFGGQGTFTVSVRDAATSPVAGAAVTLASHKGNPVSVAGGSVGTAPAATATTNSQGLATFLVSGQVAGDDELMAESQGFKSTPRKVTVSGTQLVFLTPDHNANLGVDVNHTVRVRLTESGVPNVGQPVDVSATRGTITPAFGLATNADGEVEFTITSPTAGFSAINVAVPGQGGATATRVAEFVSTTPAKVALQANPSVVGVNLTAAGTKSAQLIAVVRDAADNPVKDARVNFSSLADPSNGSIDPGFAITDSSGTALSSFIPGANTTGPEGVKLRATVASNPAIVANSSLTVSQQELSVTIGTGNTIEEADETTYRMPWTALVTDSSGNPVVNANVTVQLEPLGFRTGRWVAGAGGGGGSSGWTQVIAATCASEDINRNGRLDDLEDNIVGDVGTIGRLDPGQVAAATITSAGRVTDAFGEAKITINYPQEFGAWVRYRMRVTISAPAGTEGAAVSSFWLPVLAADIQSTDISPPGATSPVGPFNEGTSCTPL